ncbi:hypothetical protein PHLCEN_2v7439 [Hermanssonia centrifuga]|uniref:Uncharacterized protein n=1 Tax=Hermanssonia centrifuga TaxID=98765 RepID=A0A2R6NWJ6_9APHY|nr:hypothetical protein PHLCEN_2v7439 [Hermanssonia centrifuga]
MEPQNPEVPWGRYSTHADEKGNKPAYEPEPFVLCDEGWVKQVVGRAQELNLGMKGDPERL